MPQLDPSTLVVAPAPELFADATRISHLVPAFRRHGVEGEYWLLDGDAGRLPVLLIDGASALRRAAVVLALDANFSARADAAARLWRLATGRPRRRSPDRFTQQRRRRLALALRALDARLAGETYRVIGRSLFGVTRVPTGPAWKTHDLRDRTIRLVRSGLDLMQGGYRDLLRYPHRRDRA